ncbi:MAG: lipoyl(octanoyl) transferase LipB [Alphaproteobacteria bacterium]|nr:lipoyl(octanoyl) transferase LipB [Alphaproteobacteria bacterium]
MVNMNPVAPNSIALPHWCITDNPVAYDRAMVEMEARVAEISAGRKPELIWLLEHPALYTAGTSARPDDLLDPDLLPVYQTGRGGQFTYHGPGQRVVYVMADLGRRGRDLRLFVRNLEAWIISTLAVFDIKAARINGRVGVFVPRPDKGPNRFDKIAAIGIRVRRWVTFHGISINLDPNLDHYRGIVPCGISGDGVTSFADLGHGVSMAELDMALKSTFETLFGPTERARTDQSAGTLPGGLQT